MNILVINAGSSSLKYQFIKIEEEKVLAKGLCERIGIEGSKLTLKVPGKDDYIVENNMPDHSVAISMVIDALTDGEHGVISDMKDIDAVGHRVVHGGEIFADSVVIDEKVKEALKECIELAPLHNPANIIGIEACEKAMPGTPQVAVFDTAFHQQMPQKERAAAMLGKDVKDIKIVTCHLGNGSSISAVKGGHSIDTSMGFTPLAGILMGTRSGDIDPAIVTYIMEKENMSIKEVNDYLNKKSGVQGISELSSDFRDLEGSMNDRPQSKLALEMFAYGVTKYIGAYAAAMGGLDAVVFTAGIGENTPKIRAGALSGLEFLGIELDQEVNANTMGWTGLTKLSTENSKVKVYMIPTNEELVIAQDTEALVKAL